VLAAAIEAIWRDLGEPDPFAVVDAGAGPGTLLRSLLASGAAWLPAARFVAVERSDRQRAGHPAGVASVPSLADLDTAGSPFDGSPFDGVIVANELLDNMPFRLAVYDGTWREAYVAMSGSGDATRFVEVLRPFATVPAVLPPSATLGARAPVQEQAVAWVHEARRRLRRGRLVVFDYTAPSTGLVAQRPWRSWLRTYRQHERGGHYLAEPGSQDVTAEVMVDQLVAGGCAPDAVRRQAHWLQRWGIDELVEEGRRVWAERSAVGDLAALRARSRIREAEALLDPDGLGAFEVLEWTVSPAGC
jgi:SAM-dependent MidA family methyltransferase